LEHSFSDTEVGLSVQLFDRWQINYRIKSKSDLGRNFNGHELPSTDYWFIVTRADGKEYKGFTLKR
jgi:gliding motility-associated-like protein